MTNSSHTKEQQDIEQKAIKIAIIGGGLTGLLTATLLEKAFDKAHKSDSVQITIFEKSRSVGRLATRYRSSKDADNNRISTYISKQWQWAFGAQFFTAKSDSFSQFIQPWLTTGLLQPWCAKVIELTPINDAHSQPNVTIKEQWNQSQARYISTPKMTSWGRDLANKLNYSTVKFKTRVAPLSHTNKVSANKTELFDETGISLGMFDWLICTAPNAQAVDLMSNSGFSEQDKILKPEMLACYTLMLGWDSLQTLPESLNANSEKA